MPVYNYVLFIYCNELNLNSSVVLSHYKISSTDGFNSWQRIKIYVEAFLISFFEIPFFPDFLFCDLCDSLFRSKYIFIKPWLQKTLPCLYSDRLPLIEYLCIFNYKVFYINFKIR